MDALFQCLEFRVHSPVCSRQYLSFHSGAARPPETESIPNLFLHSERERAQEVLNESSRSRCRANLNTRAAICARGATKYLRHPPPSRCAAPLDSTICRLDLFSFALEITRETYEGLAPSLSILPAKLSWNSCGIDSVQFVPHFLTTWQNAKHDCSFSRRARVSRLLQTPLDDPLAVRTSDSRILPKEMSSQQREKFRLLSNQLEIITHSNAVQLFLPS